MSTRAVHRDNKNGAPAARTSTFEPQLHQRREDGGQENHHSGSNIGRHPKPITTPTASITTSLLSSHGNEGESPFLKLLIRCHTLCVLAERLLPSTSAATNRRALAYLNEARRVLAGLEKQSKWKLGGCDCTPQQRQQQQLIEFSAGILKEKLSAVEERGLADKERRDEDEHNEKTATVTAWLEDL
ncbi:hypothetical protein SLS55_008057 [Diplodia seriata]|uniref:Uncharacterized protein n=1 Tax=Diplodia seriata TaxID=420778 RepID=A0ABR3C9D3_9PEZI